MLIFGGLIEKVVERLTTKMSIFVNMEGYLGATRRHLIEFPVYLEVPKAHITNI